MNIGNVTLRMFTCKMFTCKMFTCEMFTYNNVYCFRYLQMQKVLILRIFVEHYVLFEYFGRKVLQIKINFCVFDLRINDKK